MRKTWEEAKVMTDERIRVCSLGMNKFNKYTE